MLQASSSLIGTKFPKKVLQPGFLNDRLIPFAYQQRSAYFSQRTDKWRICAEAKKQPWDFGRFFSTLYFFNGPPSPAKVYGFSFDFGFT